MLGEAGNVKTARRWFGKEVECIFIKKVRDEPGKA